MKKKKIFPYLILAGYLVLMSACGSGSGSGSGSSGGFPIVGSTEEGDTITTDTDGGQASANISLKALTTESSSTNLSNKNLSDSANNSITISSAMINISRVDLKLPSNLDCSSLKFDLSEGSCSSLGNLDSLSMKLEKGSNSNDDDDDDNSDDNSNDSDDDNSDDNSSSSDDSSDDDSSNEDHIRFSGPFIFDLLTGTSTPDLTDLSIPSGTYRRIEVKIDDLDEESTAVETGHPLLGNSMVLEGTHTEGESAREFRVILKFNEKVRFQKSGGFTINESSTVNDLVVSFSASSWFSNIDIGACLDSGRASQDNDGVYVINNDTSGDECEFKDDLKRNIKNSGTVDKDDDDDSDDDSNDDNSSSNDDDDSNDDSNDDNSNDN